MNIKIRNPKSNELPVYKCIAGFRYHTSECGITVLHFGTHDKYVDVVEGYKDGYLVLTISPFIYDKENGVYLEDLLAEEYLSHKEYYYLEVLIPAKDVTVEIIPLKHCYNIVLIPNHIVFPLDNWVDANVEVEDI